MLMFGASRSERHATYQLIFILQSRNVRMNIQIEFGISDAGQTHRILRERREGRAFSCPKSVFRTLDTPVGRNAAFK
jgi:hypothetical protein